MTELKRDKTLNKDYPFTYGYAWAPAVIDDYVFTQLHISPVSPDKGIVIREKKINGKVFYQKTALGQRMTYNALRGDLTDLGVKAKTISWPGKAVISSTKFGLYNQADVGNESKRGKIVRDATRALTYIMQDSGGFQLVSGVEDFVDPLDVARKHTLFADSGVSLDLPVSGLTDREVVMAAASMLVANTKIILDNTDPAVKIMNVCHGSTIELRDEFITKVIKEPAHSLCIAGLRRSAVGFDAEFDRTSPLAFASHIILSMLRTEKLYQHYHVLGVATPWQMGLISLIANLHQKIVTSDSASHSLSAKSGLLLDYADQQAYKNTGYKPTSYGPTYCSCPMCVEIKHGLWHKMGASWMPAIHNIYGLTRTAETYDGLAKALLKANADAKTIARELLMNSPSLTHVQVVGFAKAVKFIMDTKNPSQVKNLPTGSQPKTLFKVAKKSTVPPRMIEIVKKYEKYHNKKWLK